MKSLNKDRMSHSAKTQQNAVRFLLHGAISQGKGQQTGMRGMEGKNEGNRGNGGAGTCLEATGILAWLFFAFLLPGRAGLARKSWQGLTLAEKAQGRGRHGWFSRALRPVWCLCLAWKNPAGGSPGLERMELKRHPSLSFLPGVPTLPVFPELLRGTGRLQAWMPSGAQRMLSGGETKTSRLWLRMTPDTRPKMWRSLRNTSADSLDWSSPFKSCHRAAEDKNLHLNKSNRVLSISIESSKREESHCQEFIECFCLFVCFLPQWYVKYRFLQLTIF